MSTPTAAVAWQASPLPATATQPTSAPQDAALLRERLRANVRTSCGELIDLAVKRPYGWAWSAQGIDPRLVKARSIEVSMAPGDSPAAGLAMLLSGEALGEPRFSDAGHEAARGAAASVTRNGNVLATPTFGPAVGGRDDPAYIPSRRATTGGLALMLTDLDMLPDGDPRKDLVRRGASRALHWLMKQQGRNGAWPSGYPADVLGREAQRLIRLDGPDYRDCTAALFLAGEVMDNQPARRMAQSACDMLLRLRLNGPMDSAKLWATAYEVEGATLEPELNFPSGADLVATRVAVQTLLIGYLWTGHEPYRTAILEAADTLRSTRVADGTWPRFPNPGLTRKPSTQAVRGAASTRRAFEEPYPRGSFGAPEVIELARSLEQTRRDVLLQRMSGFYSLKRQAALGACELLEWPGALRIRANSNELPDLVGGAGSTAPFPATAPSSELRERAREIWGQLHRAVVVADSDE